MTSRLFAICFRANEPLLLARFWAGMLERKLVADPVDGIALPPEGETAIRLRFVPSREPKVGQNRAHFDLTSRSLADQKQTVARALELGGRHIDIGQDPDDGHVVLADPEGNEFCVIEADNNFLSGCGAIGALSCDGSQEVGYFWSEALGWPLVWDQDQETAIQSPDGGTKISWGGPPLMPRLGRDRLHLDLALPAGADQRAEVERLLALGATRVDTDQTDTDQTDTSPAETGRLVLADPDGNEFCLLAPR